MYFHNKCRIVFMSVYICRHVFGHYRYNVYLHAFWRCYSAFIATFADVCILCDCVCMCAHLQWHTSPITQACKTFLQFIFVNTLFIFKHIHVIVFFCCAVVVVVIVSKNLLKVCCLFLKRKKETMKSNVNMDVTTYLFAACKSRLLPLY